MKSSDPAQALLLERETVNLYPFGSTNVVLVLAQGVVEEL